MDWAQILVIILAIFLAIFLLLAIILIVMLIKVTHQIKSVTNSAQRTVNHIEVAVARFTNATSPMMIVRLLKKFLHKDKKKGE